MSAGLKLITTTLADEDQAAVILRTLLAERLVACGNIIPQVRSIYHWDGKLCDEREVVLIVKTTPAHATKAMERLADLHPYDVPAIELLGVEGAHLPFLAWVHSETK